MKKLVALIFSGLLLLGLGGCETMKGMGKDIENLGKALNRKADEASK